MNDYSLLLLSDRLKDSTDENVAVLGEVLHEEILTRALDRVESDTSLRDLGEDINEVIS